MKKVYKLIVIAFFFLAISGCGKKEISPETFEASMKELNYYVLDAKGELENLDYISSALIAVNSNYQIEFYDFVDKEHAATFYGNNKLKFDDEEEATKKEESGINYVKYTYESEDVYKIIEVIGKTVIYSNANKTYKENLNRALENLGY